MVNLSHIAHDFYLSVLGVMSPAVAVLGVCDVFLSMLERLKNALGRLKHT